MPARKHRNLDPSSGSEGLATFNSRRLLGCRLPKPPCPMSRNRFDIYETSGSESGRIRARPRSALEKTLRRHSIRDREALHPRIDAYLSQASLARPGLHGTASNSIDKLSRIGRGHGYPVARSLAFRYFSTMLSWPLNPTSITSNPSRRHR